MEEARIKLLQRMPVFGGVRADIIQFLLGLCPAVSVPANEYFFHEHDQADSMFVIEAGKVAVLKSWHGEEYLLRILKEGDCFGEMAVMAAQRLGPRNGRLHRNPSFSGQPLPCLRTGSQAVRADPDEHGSGSDPTAPGNG
jgi:CRP-like cAMP-binding protein